MSKKIRSFCPQQALAIVLFQFFMEFGTVSRQGKKESRKELNKRVLAESVAKQSKLIGNELNCNSPDYEDLTQNLVQ